MKKLVNLIIMSTLMLALVSCQKEENIIKDSRNFIKQGQVSVLSENEKLMSKFANCLAAAMVDSKELRKLIKEESLKQFDNDNDVLYQLIRNKIVDGKTVYELLTSYDVSKEEFDIIDNQLPLLTILVPTLPEFTPENWNVDMEIPKVAVAVMESDYTPIYSADHSCMSFSNECIPGFPVLVIKQNERLKVTSNENLKSCGNVKFSYDFIDDCFNPKMNKCLKSVGDASDFDPRAIEAFNLGMAWQRDYVYYGLTPTSTTGKYRSNYSEYLTDFKLENWDVVKKISDQKGDPKVNDEFIGKGFSSLSSVRRYVSKMWVDGSFEFQVTSLINSKNGVGSTITKYFMAKPNELVEVQYAKKRVNSSYIRSVYFVAGVKCKYYNPNLELVQWDLNNYGMSWKIFISEVDLQQEISETVETSTTFAANIKFSIKGLEKIGLEFGASASTTKKTSHVIKTKLESDPLGEVIVNFSDPIITKKEGSKFYSREVSTGHCLFSIKPKNINE